MSLYAAGLLEWQITCTLPRHNTPSLGILGSNPGRGKTFFSSLKAKTGRGAYPTFHPVGTRVYFPGGKTAGACSRHSSPYSAEIKRLYLCFTSTYDFLAAFLIKHRDNLICNLPFRVGSKMWNCGQEN
jgi:hypothetical protein